MMSEFEREEVLAARLDEKQRLADKRILSQMVKSQRGGAEDSVAQAAKRKHRSTLPQHIPLLTRSQVNIQRGAPRRTSQEN